MQKQKKMLKTTTRNKQNINNTNNLKTTHMDTYKINKTQ